MYELNLRLSQAMIASLIGQTRESTTRNLKQLKQSGVVTYTSGVYVVDRPRLEKFIGEDSFRDLLAA
jgi:CRP-like cAMP-binding protein